MTSATIEFIRAGVAVVEVTYPDGTFGVYTLEGHDLYERGYDLADQCASERGFRLDKYSTVASQTGSGFVWSEGAALACGFRLEYQTPRRPCNGLNVEWFGGASRCFLKPDAVFKGSDDLARRWLLSGGNIAVFAPCNSNCPRQASRTSN